MFLRDHQAGTTSRVNLNSNGEQSNGDSYPNLAISGDGRYVVFPSAATNLVPGIASGRVHIYVRDTSSGTTTLASVTSTGAEANQGSSAPAISADGRHVAFVTGATNLSTLGTNSASHIYVHDRQTGVTTAGSVDSAGVFGLSTDVYPVLSADGRYLAFTSDNQLVPGDTNFRPDAYVRDRQTGQTTRVSVSSAGVGGDNGGTAAGLSADGRYVGFTSTSTNLVPDDVNGKADVFVHDRDTGTTTLVNLVVGGIPASSAAWGQLSSTGRYVLMGSADLPNDLFVHDRQTGTSARMTRALSTVAPRTRSSTAPC